MRESTAIIELGISDNVILVGLWREGLSQDEFLSENVRIVRVKGPFQKRANSSWTNVLVFIVLFFRFASLALREKPFAINIHALTLLPFGVLVKWIAGCALIYDAHELETETHESQGFRKALARFLEWLFIRFVDHTVVVSHSIENWYRQRYAVSKITTIKNIPVFKNQNYDSDLRSIVNVSQDTMLYIYVGLLAAGRGIEEIIACFSKANLLDRHVVFIGYGDLEDIVRQSVSSNIHFLPAVPPSQVAYYVSGADVGLSLIEATCLSFYYSLPNKVFEYLSAGLPFISSDFPDIRLEFEEYGVCWFRDSGRSLEKIIEGISVEEVMRRKRNVMEHRSKWDWNVEKMRLLDVYASTKKTGN